MSFILVCTYQSYTTDDSQKVYSFTCLKASQKWAKPRLAPGCRGETATNAQVEGTGSEQMCLTELCKSAAPNCIPWVYLPIGYCDGRSSGLSSLNIVLQKNGCWWVRTELPPSAQLSRCTNRTWLTPRKHPTAYSVNFLVCKYKYISNLSRVKEAL